MATKDDLRLMMLAHLRVVPETTTTVPAEQARRADLYIDASRAMLLEKGLCWWDEDSIPDAVVDPLSKYVAARACSAFGKAGKGYEAQEVPARMEIAALKSSEERPTARTQYF